MSDPSKCPHCQGPMKPLFTGSFCPNDCDKPEVRAAAALYKKQLAEAKAAVISPASVWGNLATWIPASPTWPVGGGIFPLGGVPPAPLTLPPHDQCTDPMCRAKGKKTHCTATTNPNGTITWTDHYECTTCARTWSYLTPKPTLSGATIP